MKRKFLSLILVFAMTVSLLTVGTGAVEPTYGDTAGHWAESSIERWSGHGIIQGSNGLFAPDGQLTCAQLATILAKLLKLPAAKDAGFTDNKADAWYYDAINRCTAAGILNGNGDGTVTPEAPIARERAMVMLARALGIEPLRNPDLTRYTDAAQVSAYAQGYVAALIEAGIVGGVTADELAPQDNINRASTVTILDRAISTYADEAGATVKVDGKGIVLVVAENVKITGAPEGTKIVVADGATDLTVNGKSVSNDQTYIVPKTEPAKPSSSSSGGYSHSHSYVYTDNGDGTHTGRCYANDSTLAPEAHKIVDGKCTVCGAEADGKTASVKNIENVISYHDTLADAITAARAGDTVYLLKDLSSGNVWLKDGVTLNLGGHTIDANGGYGLRAANGIEATVKNGTITKAYSSLVVFGAEDKDNPTVVTVDSNVTISNSSYGIIFTGYDKDYNFTGKTGFATLNFNGTINAEQNQCAIFVMGNLGNDSASVAAIGEDGNQINIGASAKITTHDVAIVLNGMAKLTVVDGATIEGADAITMKRGYLDITGGTFKGTGENHTPTDAEHSGAESSGSAITVSSTYNYSGVIDVKISGGTFTSTNSYGFYAGQSVEGDQQIAFTNTNFAISGGTFTGGNGGVFFATGKHITGGTFSSDPSEYVAPYYKATKNGDVWEVAMIFADGSGTAEAPFVIQNAEQFKAFRDNVNAGDTFAGKTIKLMADIDLNNEAWTPIGTESNPFVGTFDGNNKTISNLKITAGNYAGLFGYVSTATIKDVKLAKADVSGGERMATLIGKITGNATVTNCSNDDASSVTGSDSNTGGLIGEIVNGTVALTNLVNNAAVKNTKESNSRAGGVVAQVTTGANVTLTNCTNNGAVNTNNGYAGGIVSAYQSGTMNIANCVNNGNLVGAYKGNMLGWYTSIRSITISSDTTEFDINAIGCIDIATTSDMSLYGKRYFVNRKADLTGVSTTAQTFSEIFAKDQIGNSPKALWDKLIAFYAFAAETNSNFAGYPKDYWSMFNQSVGYSEPDWDTYFNGYNAKCEEAGRTDDKLTKEEFTHATWREKIVYLAP